MTSIELLYLLSIIAIIWYWFNGLQARETAIKAGKLECQKQGLAFLDESVALAKIRLRRNTAGQIVFYREYGFEFTSDGAFRYTGRIYMLGKRVIKIEMDAYRQTTALH